MSRIGERRWQLSLQFPFAKAVEKFRSLCLRRDDYDPATTFVWGQMMAMGVLRILEAVEERFGAEGQEVCRRAINDLGREIFLDMAAGVEIPADLNDIEVASLIASWVNEVLYASIEEPFVRGVMMRRVFTSFTARIRMSIALLIAGCSDISSKALCRQHVNYGENVASSISFSAIPFRRDMTPVFLR